MHVAGFKDTRRPPPPPELQRLSLRGRGLTSVVHLRPLAQLRVLCLNHNHLTDLRGLASCHFLNELYVSYNWLKDLRVLLELTGLQQLQVLHVVGNPWQNLPPTPTPTPDPKALVPAYTQWIHRHLPQVVRLDGKSRPYGLTPPQPPAQTPSRDTRRNVHAHFITTTTTTTATTTRQNNNIILAISVLTQELNSSELAVAQTLIAEQRRKRRGLGEDEGSGSG
ncbi:hypothetical protein BJ085DRAFT_39002 [Dimargaris cristalligena]|uniref:Leucine-rich repeat-domain-containing protein n=1 Tax=Dimargaris cristalligena TaxID=215637 RepID=A0A4P9ZWZ7_9FUNG|nr:hypothetical protein BJ085DRAFT_39002 [Dimargaris cristalligena]|eukprot:RKP38205.1 hypothetical protein BJ085DRAFT_39002 [Dimargaris cristalligena]